MEITITEKIIAASESERMSQAHHRLICASCPAAVAINVALKIDNAFVGHERIMFDVGLTKYDHDTPPELTEWISAYDRWFGYLFHDAPRPAVRPVVPFTFTLPE